MAKSYNFPIPTAALCAALILSTSWAGAAGGSVYIPAGESGEVVVVDAATGAQTGRIADLPAAHGLAVTPDGRWLVVGSFDERVPGAALPEKPAGVSAADHAAHHGGGSSAAAATGVSTVSIVDTATRTVQRRIDVPGAVHHVAIRPDGTRAVVTHPNADAITAIDLQSFQVIRTVPTGSAPNYLAFSPDGAQLYVSNAGEGAVAILDTGSWRVVGRVTTGESPEHLVLSSDGSRLMVSNVGSGSVSIIDTDSRVVIETLPVGDTPHGIDISEDAATVFVALRGEDKLTAIDLPGRTSRSIQLTPAPYHLSAIRGTGLLYVSSAEEPRIWLIDAATLEPRGEIGIPGIGHQFGQAPGD